MTSLPRTDFSSRLDGTAVRDLLLLLVGWHEDEYVNQQRVDQALDAYRDDRRLAIVGIEGDDHLFGLLGVEQLTAHRAVIRHIVVHPSTRGRGIGRRMLVQAIARFELSALMAETDADAVGFYKRCGCMVQSLGEKYPGVERFSCMWRHTLGERAH